MRTGSLIQRCSDRRCERNRRSGIFHTRYVLHHRCRDSVLHDSDSCHPPNVSKSLHSWLRNLHLYHVKVTARHVQTNARSYAHQYASGISILELSRKENYPPSLMSRCIVEQVASLPDGKKNLTRSMRDPIGVLGNVNSVSSDYAESERYRPDCKGRNGYVSGRFLSISCN